MSNRYRISGLSIGVLLVLAISAAGTVIDVRQDGSGDYLTIGGAIAAATSGDEIVIGPGTYAEDLHIDEDLQLRALNDAATTILDGEDSHRLMLIDGGCDVAISGLTFTRAYGAAPTHGGAVFIGGGSRAAFDACVFADNRSGWDNGALHANGPGTDVTVSNTTFVGNYAVHNGGACGVHTSASLTLDGCDFRDNHCSEITGACNAYNAFKLAVYGCTFVDNTAIASGAILVEGSSADIVGNTFHGNSSANHASVYFYVQSNGVFRRNIVASDALGAGLKIFDSGSCDHDCNLFDDNAEGSVIGDDLQPYEYEMPALFCDADGGDFSLCADSPALEEANGCGLMGAFDQGCGACGGVAIESKSWSSVKQMFR